MKKSIKILFSIFLIIFVPSLTNAWHEERLFVIVKEPCFSPDGTRIIFTSNIAYRNVDIWEIKVDGTGLKRLTKNIQGGVIWNPCFSPDGRMIVYQLESEIWIMNADGTGKKKVDKWPPWYSTIEKISPDRTKVVFIYGPDVSEPIFNIYIENIDGTGRRQITFGNFWDRAPSWHPDGSKIIFHSNRDNTNGIWQVNIDGTGLRCINPYGDDPVYSPDGEKIAFVREGNLWIMNADGTDEKKLTNFEEVIEPIVPVKFDPDKWNIEWLDKKEGEGYINCYIGGIEGDAKVGVEGYSVDKIETKLIELTVEVPVGKEYVLYPEGPSKILNNHPGFKGKVLKIKFNKFKAITTLKNNESSLQPGKKYELLIRGVMKDSQKFYGKAKIEVIGKF